MELGLLATVLGTILGGGSLWLGVLPHLRTKGRNSSLRNALRSIERTPDRSREHDKRTKEAQDDSKAHWDRLVAWLDKGELLLEPVRQRLIRRLVVIAFSAVLTVSAIPFDIQPNPFFNETTGSLELHDVGLLIALLIGPFFAFREKWTLSKQEREFLKNLNDLYEAFYEKEVVGKLDEFNSECDVFFNR